MLNLFSEIPEDLPEELVNELVNQRGVRVERIVSQGHRSPDDFWYEQSEHEWVLVIQGAGRLSFEDRPDVLLSAGDSLLIPAGQRHRVEWTDPLTATIWLTVFFGESSSQAATECNDHQNIAPKD